MKSIITLFAGTLVLIATAFAQSKPSKTKTLEAQIIKLDIMAWQAWKDKNADWFKKHTTETFLSINAEGVSNKAEVIKATPTECDVKSFSLDDFKFVVLDDNTVILSYIAKQDGVCSGKKIAPKVRAAVTYVKRNGNWIEAFYIETPVGE